MIPAVVDDAPVRTIAIVPQPERMHAARPASQPGQCSICSIRGHCLARDLDNDHARLLDTLLFARRRIAAGQALCHEGDRFQFLYAVRSGMFKTTVTLEDGREQVTGFQMAGDLIGLDGIGARVHASSASALEDAEVCVVEYASLAALSQQRADVQLALERLMSREIVREHTQMLLLGTMNAEERVAAFLLDLSRRLCQRGWSAREFHLRMSRAEIGSYLGMTLETVSRTFSAFQHAHLLEVDKRHLRILDLEALSRVCGSRSH